MTIEPGAAGHAALLPSATRRRAARGGALRQHSDRNSRAAQRLAGQDQHEGEALQHQHRRIGQAEPPLQQAAGGAEAAEQDRHRDDRQRVVARDERHQDAGVAAARRSATRWRWCAPPPPRSPPARPAQAPPSAQASDDQPVRRQAHQRAARALPPTTRSGEAVRACSAATAPASRQATTPKRQAPVHVGSRTMPPMRRPRRAARVDGLFRLAGSRSGPFDEVLEQRDRDVAEQQAADRLVDAAVLAQRAGQRDPQPRRPARRPAAAARVPADACRAAASA